MDAQALAADLLQMTRSRVVQFGAERRRMPCLATVLVGEDPASHTYVRMKANRYRDAAIDSRRLELDAPTTTQELVAVIIGLSADAGVDGILL